MASDKKKSGDGEKLIVKNRRATFDYSVEEHFEGGLILVGSEVKSMRAGKVDLSVVIDAKTGQVLKISSIKPWGDV